MINDSSKELQFTKEDFNTILNGITFFNVEMMTN